MINERVNGGLQPKTPVGDSSPVSSAVPRPAVSPAAPQAATESPSTESETSAAAVEPARIDEAVKKLNDHMQNMRRKLTFSVEESTGRTVISVYDAETEELIRQIPPEETLQLAQLLEEQAQGLLVRDQA